MDDKTFMIIASAAMWVGVIPLLVGFIRISRRPIYLKLIWILTLVSFTCDIVGFIVHHQLPGYLGVAYTLLEFELLLGAYYNALNRKHWRSQFTILGALFGLFFVVDVLFLEPGGRTPSYSATVSALVFIVLSIVYFFDLMNELPEKEFARLPMFWVNLGVLIFFAGSLFVFAVFNYIAVSLKANVLIYWTFHDVLDLTKNILFAIALWPRTPTQRPAKF